MRSIAAILAGVLASGCAASSNQSVAKPIAAQQQRACLHGENETPEQRARRSQALALARQINTLEYNVAMRNTKMFQPVANLGLTASTPAGFEVHLTTDGTTYAFSLKDTVDPCLFGFFSDHKGTIFEGRVIQ